MPKEGEKVIIIGAGPAGLAMAGQLKERGIPYQVLDKADTIASSWRGHYDRLCLHTVKQYSNLPGAPFPKDYPTYVPKDKLIEYYSSYVTDNELEIKFNKELRNVRKSDEGWSVNLRNGESMAAHSVVFATGVNRTINVPNWKNQDLFDGEILHSRFYKNTEPYRNKRVLIIGMGNTGAEIALDLAENSIETYLSVRNQVLIVPRDIFGRPAQLTAQQLSKLPFGIGDSIGNFTRKTIIGNLTNYGIRLNPIAPVKHLRETGSTPVMDLGTVRMIKRGKIKVIQDVVEFTKNSVIDDRGNKFEIDEVILATGYRPSLKEFIPFEDNFFDKNGLPTSHTGTGKYEGLFFIGFDNYQLGGILGSINRDAPVIANAILQRKES